MTDVPGIHAAWTCGSSHRAALVALALMSGLARVLAQAVTVTARATRWRCVRLGFAFIKGERSRG